VIREPPLQTEYEFTLREGLTFHNGDPFTAEDVKFSFERYKRDDAAVLRERVKAVEIVGPIGCDSVPWGCGWRNQRSVSPRCSISLPRMRRCD
jgi:hypothetical protein